MAGGSPPRVGAKVPPDGPRGPSPASGPDGTVDAMRSILVGIDSSPEAMAALRWAAGLAGATGQELTLAFAWQHGGRLEGLDVATPGPDAAELEAGVEARLQELAGQLDDPGLVTTCRALRGDPATALLREADRRGAGLVVVGASGTGGALRSLLGSVSRQLTECPDRAVAVVAHGEGAADDEPAGPGTLVVGVDGSAGSSRAVRWAGEVARRSGADVVVVHAAEVPPDLGPDDAAGVVHESRQRVEDEWCGPLRRLGVAHRVVHEPGDPHTLVSRVADEVRPRAVVVGSRGLGPVSQRLLGSVTHRLVRELGWPTVIVPSPRDRVAWEP